MQLANKNFVERAPEALIAEKRAHLAMLETTTVEIKDKLSSLS